MKNKSPEEMAEEYAAKFPFKDLRENAVNDYLAGFEAASKIKDVQIQELVEAIKSARACIPEDLARPRMFLNEALTNFKAKQEAEG